MAVYAEVKASKEKLIQADTEQKETKIQERAAADEQAAVYRRFPEWSPQRHMFMDAPQRQAVRDLLGLATALDNKGVMVMPKLWCHCDRYWGFLRKCRFPYVPNMALPSPAVAE